MDRTTGAAKEMPLGHVFIAIDIAALTDVDQFKTAAGNFCRALRASGTAKARAACERQHVGRALMQASVYSRKPAGCRPCRW